MRVYVFMLSALGVAVVVVVSVVMSLIFDFRRRRGARLTSARNAAARFRRRYGIKAEAAVAKRLDRGELSPRGRRFFKLIAIELKASGTAPAAPSSPEPQPTEGATT